MTVLEIAWTLVWATCALASGRIVFVSMRRYWSTVARNRREGGLFVQRMLGVRIGDARSADEGVRLTSVRNLRNEATKCLLAVVAAAGGFWTLTLPADLSYDPATIDLIAWALVVAAIPKALASVVQIGDDERLSAEIRRRRVGRGSVAGGDHVGDC